MVPGVASLWICVRLISQPLQCVCLIKASSVLATCCSCPWGVWCHWCHRSMWCSLGCPGGLLLFELLRQGARELTRLWDQTMNVYCCPFHVNVSSFWSSFLTGTENITFTKSVGACHVPEVIFICSSKDPGSVWQLHLGLLFRRVFNCL